MSKVKVAIVPRKMQFNFAAAPARSWCCNDDIRSALLNAASLALPAGEQFFIRSIRQFENRVDGAVLQGELKRFVAQEAIHSRQHQNYNEQMQREGFEIEVVERRAQDALNDLWERSSPMERLAATIALEHITHVLGHQFLKSSRHMQGWNEEYRAFWLWHAAEEIEHKAVCYDLYESLGGSYTARATALLSASHAMFRILLQNQYDLLRQASKLNGTRMPSLVEIQRVNLEFAFAARTGILRGASSQWLAWFRPSYHPWQHDNRAELKSWASKELSLHHVSNLGFSGDQLAMPS